MTLGSPDSNGVGRYVGTTSLATTIHELLNLGLASVSAVISTIRHRDKYIEMTVTAASTTSGATPILGTAGALAYVEVADANAWHDATTNPTRITPTVAGRYEICVFVEWASNATGIRVIQIGRNGVFTNSVRDVVVTSGDSVGSAQLKDERTMNGTTDYFTVSVFQNSGGALNVTARVVARYLGPS